MSKPTPTPNEDAPGSAWPRLDVGAGRETKDTLLLWAQIIGKTRLALSPMVNHWWQVPLYLSARGLTTSPIPVGARIFDLELDLIAHRLHARASDGALESMSLGDCTLGGFYGDYLGLLGRLGVDVHLQPFAVEIPERVPFDDETRACRYDAAWANRFFRALIQADDALKRFRGGFIGKASPVHFFWGGADLAVTRFSGRAAPPFPGRIPHVGDWVMKEAYSHEVSSAGFWPGDARFPEAAFYSYAYPEPRGFAAAAVHPAAARYDPALGEFVLPYAAVRASADPAADVQAFLESTYAAAAELADWDRKALERSADAPPGPGSLA